MARESNRSRKIIWTIEEWKAFGYRCQAVRAKANALPSTLQLTPGLKAATLDALIAIEWKFHVAMVVASDLLASQRPEARFHSDEIILGAAETRDAMDPVVLSCKPELNLAGSKRYPRNVLTREQWATLGREVRAMRAEVFFMASEIHDVKDGQSAYRRFAATDRAIARVQCKLDDLVCRQHIDWADAISVFFGGNPSLTA